MHKKARALDVLQKAHAQSLALACALDKARDVRDDKALAGIVFIDDNAKVGNKGCEGIGRNLGPCGRDSGQEGGLSGIGKAKKASVCQYLEFKAQCLVLAL